MDGREWANTTAGDWISRGKYWYKSDPEQQAQIGRQAAQALVAVLQVHPAFTAASVIVDVPGHDAKQVSFGQRLALTVARDSGKPFVRVSSDIAFRAPAKNIDDIQGGPALAGSFRVLQPLSGARVLVVVDVFRSGRSMTEVARACRAAGATTVHGLCVVRTMRS